MSFLHALNDAAAGISISQLKKQSELEPPPPIIAALIQVLEQIADVINTCPPHTTPSRFGNPAFRDFLTAVKGQTHIALTKVLNQLAVDPLPIIPKRVTEQIKQEDDKQRPHIHLPHKVPEKVLDSMRARGELVDQPTPTAQVNDETHDQTHEHTHNHSHAAPDTIMEDAVSVSRAERINRIASSLCQYLDNAFGDIRRIDYGTGHEMNFICFCYAITQCTIQYERSTDSEGVMPDTFTLRHLALSVIPTYLSVVRKLVVTYLLEPAGSRGVWGLDDYSFIPFILGSSQLINHPHIKPKSILNNDIIDGFHSDYIYLTAIKFITSVKTQSFAEHSPMLYDITMIKTWKQVNNGLIKMYSGEVLSKYAVIQHFIYSIWLKKDIIGTIVNPESITNADTPLCCTDGMHIPASISAQRS